MSDYKLERDEDGEVLGCDLCQSDVPTALYDRYPGQKNASLCQLCASSFAGHTYLYSYNNPEAAGQMYTCGTVNHAANLILAELRAIRTALESNSG